MCARGGGGSFGGRGRRWLVVCVEARSPDAPRGFLSARWSSFLTRVAPSCFTRCVKPNPQKKARVFDNELVVHQLRYLGVLDVVTTRRDGFFWRGVHAEFVRRCVVRFFLLARRAHTPSLRTVSRVVGPTAPPLPRFLQPDGGLIMWRRRLAMALTSPSFADTSRTCRVSSRRARATRARATRPSSSARLATTRCACARSSRSRGTASSRRATRRSRTSAAPRRSSR